MHDLKSAKKRLQQNAKQPALRAATKKAAKKHLQALASLPGQTPIAKGHRYLELLGVATLETRELIDTVHEGLPFLAWENFCRNTKLPPAVCELAAHLSPTTLRRRKLDGRLRADESDRLVRLARIFDQAFDLFAGNAEQARGWLTSSQPALHGATPLEYAATEIGAREVESLIGRLEHGIPS